MVREEFIKLITKKDIQQDNADDLIKKNSLVKKKRS